MFKLICIMVLSLTIGGLLNPITLLNGPIERTTQVSEFKELQIDFPKSEYLKKDKTGIKYTKIKRILLESKNTISLNGPITADSVAKLQAEFMKKSLKLSKSSKIYLVLYTPGGDVYSGLALIDSIKAIPQRVETITIFSASMGFEIVQSLNKRYITTTGVLMSHRASGSIGGEFSGNLEKRYELLKRRLTYMEVVAARRMGISLKAYRKLIRDEYWVSGFDAVPENAADQIAYVNCGKSLNGYVKRTVSTFFGPVYITSHKCPTIVTPIKIDFTQIKSNLKRLELKKLFNMFYTDKIKFINTYIKTNKINKYFIK